MLKHESRILFLREFTKQIILNSKPSEDFFYKEQEETGKIPTHEEVIELEKYLPGLMHESSSLQQISAENFQLQKKDIRNFQLKIPQRLVKKPIQLVKPYTTPLPQKNISMLFNPDLNLTPGFELGKLNFLIRDPRITVIECPGPEKFIIARTEGRTTLTKLAISQQEIQEIIDKFSKESKIPILSGLFKAAVGNLIITAIISSLVGDRFIITKITPRFIIEQNAGK